MKILVLIALLSTVVTAASASEAFDGTVERFAHGSLDVRSLDDCKMHFLSIPSTATPNERRAIENEILFILQRRQNVHIVMSSVYVPQTSGSIENIVDISPTSRQADADQKCVTSLGKSYVDGTVSGLRRGNASASLTLRLVGGHTVEFSWTYHVDDPKIDPRIAVICDRRGMGVTCPPKHPRVRVTYKTEVTGDGAALIPLSIDAII